MLKSFCTIAYRNLIRHKFFTAINMACLALGISFSFIIGVYVLDQYGINSNLKNLDRQYIIKSDWKIKEMGLEMTTFGSLAKALQTEYPSLVANYYRYNPVTNVVSAGEQHYKEDIAIGDTNFISMYGFPLLQGNPQQPFTNNSSAVITQTMATKLYGDANAVGKRLSVLTTVQGLQQDYTVSAVLKDLPYNSITHRFGDGYAVFLPTVGNNYYGGGDPAEGWQGAYEAAGIELQPGVTPQQLKLPLQHLLAKYTDEKTQKNLTVVLAPVSDYYLKDNNGAALSMIRILAAAASFILLMAIINFVNINIGTSSYRLKEIGLRKVFGSGKKQLIAQFITEALLLTTVAAALSLVLYECVRPVFAQILHTSFAPVNRFTAGQVTYFLLLVLATGTAAGIYPAFILSSSRIINAVRGKIDSATGGMTVRKTMLVVQFTLATIVFICAMTVSRQVSYIFSRDIGYSKDQVLVITAFPKQWDSAGVNRMMNIKNAMMQLSSVNGASLSFEIPDRKPPGSIDMQAANGNGRTVLVTSCGTDDRYASVFGLKLVSGSCFAPDAAFIPNQVVLNESAVKALGLTVNNATGRQISTPSSPGTLLTVAGVVKDYNYSNLQEAIGPIAFFNVRDAKAYRYLSIKLHTNNMVQSLALVKNKWKELSPNAPFEYTFMDDKFASLYQSELQLKTAAGIATAVNLLIILLGVFGVVTITLTKRTREIAVRKVLGAGIKDITLLFTKDYAWLMLIANAVAWPLAWTACDKWLQGYAYRVNQSIVPYLLVGLVIFAASVCLIVMQCIKAGSANPVKSLKTE